MTNPFQLYSPALLAALMKAGHVYFVRQTYARGIDHFEERLKGAFLISHYREEGHARMHYEALQGDRSRYLYNIQESVDLAKLEVAAWQPQGYKVYAPLLLRPWEPSGDLKGKVRRYIDKHLKWRQGAVRTNLFTQFGELFLTLKKGTQEISIPLSAVERL